MHLPSAWLILFLPLLETSLPSQTVGIKMTIEYGSGAGSSRHTSYLQPDRKRMEYRNSFGEKQADGTMRTIYGPPIAAIIRCDLGQTFELNLDASEYTSAIYPPKPFTREEMEKRGLPAKITYLSDKPTLRIEVTTRDTGERKEMFGHAARHVVTTRKQIPLEGSLSDEQEITTDGWYIDFNDTLPCDRKPGGKSHGYVQATSGGKPLERPEFVAIGEPEKGFAVSSVSKIKNTHKFPDGTVKTLESSQEVKVVELEQGRLDPALFEIPGGFRHVDHIERNPPTNSAGQSFFDWPRGLWQRLTDRIAELFH